MTRILIVEDEQEQREILIDFFEQEGFHVFHASNGQQALEVVTQQKFNIILLDIMIPKINGLDVCQRLRNQNHNTPIIILSAKSEEVDKILGLELGADDYVTKPFSLKELHARIRVQLRKTDPISHDKKQPYLLPNGKKIDLTQCHVSSGDTNTSLSKTEIQLLQYFIKTKGQVLHRNDILNHIWGYSYLPESRIIDAHIVNLRKKIETDYKNPEILLTVHGIGYQFTSV